MITCVVPVNRWRGTLERCLASVPTDIPLFIYDTSGGDERIREAAGNRASYRSGPDQGMATNFNAAMPLAQDGYVHLLHDDDHVLPGFYDILRLGAEARYQIWEERPTSFGQKLRRAVGMPWQRENYKTGEVPYGVLCTGYRCETADGKTVFEKRGLPPTGAGRLDWRSLMLQGNPLVPPCFAVHVKAFLEVGGYRNVPFLDWDLLIRLTRAGYQVWCDSGVHAVQGVHIDSATARDGRGVFYRGANDLLKLLEQEEGVILHDARNMFASCARAEGWIDVAAELLDGCAGTMATRRMT